MDNCQCLPCQVTKKYRALGVPDSVMDFYQLQLFKQHTLGGEDFAEHLEARLSYLMKLREAANEMIDKGEATDEEFMRAVMSSDPCESANMFTRITDYIKRQAG